jgi:hypothetical protein
MYSRIVRPAMAPIVVTEQLSSRLRIFRRDPHRVAGCTQACCDEPAQRSGTDDEDLGCARRSRIHCVSRCKDAALTRASFVRPPASSSCRGGYGIDILRYERHDVPS